MDLVRPVNPSNNLFMAMKAYMLEMRAIKPIFENSIRKICRKEVDCSSIFVCFLVYSPRLLKIGEMNPLIRTALVATTAKIIDFVNQRSCSSRQKNLFFGISPRSTCTSVKTLLNKVHGKYN